jgi:hypothetical protein
MPNALSNTPLTARLSPDEYRRRLALMLVQGGLNTAPIQSPWQGAARMAQAFMGGLLSRDLQNAPQPAVGAPASAAPGPARTQPAAPTSAAAAAMPKPQEDAWPASALDIPYAALQPGLPLSQNAFANDPQAFIHELLANPDTRELGLQLQRAGYRSSPGAPE